jgi:small subunit ribosomal protein S6
MAMYETVVILDSLMPPKDIDDTVEHVSKVITENGGKINTVDKWGKRRLAYEIQKKQYGFYFAIEFEAEGNIPTILQSDYNFNDNVLRYLTYRYDKHQIKALEQKNNKPQVSAIPENIPAAKAAVSEPVIEEDFAELEDQGEDEDVQE